MTQADFYEQKGVAMTCRSFDEYRHMFALTKKSLAQGPILDVAAGASSFTATANNRGFKAFAVDPYQLPPKEIKKQGEQEIALIAKKLPPLTNRFLWDYYQNLNRHHQIRVDSLEMFLEDYERDSSKSRYLTAELPHLPFRVEPSHWSFAATSSFFTTNNFIPYSIYKR
ncbi:hypothetical protein [Desmospora profundinema]|uniref:Class I SAM-dependent methyltransferase n=1 Tax=Desmospora profundinema TaxID=1571184 RepID=A0ABU1IJH0_9BACL|nr:hypothetical protein [Desmospora profundinema]MDR6224927.1 hypothetical protein [Desmospora profundinema]